MLATGCGFPALPGLASRNDEAKTWGCRIDAVILYYYGRKQNFYHFKAVRNHDAVCAVTIRHRMSG
jgi:hypothetical protein